MMSTKITESSCHPEKRLIVTHISGDIDKNDVEIWERSLKAALSQIEDNGLFKIFVNLYGFKATDFDAHKQYRSIIPLTLADYGWKVGYLNLFEEEAKELKYTNTRGIKCVGAAHCHQDSTKIELYQSKFSSEREHFFTDPKQAEAWIEGLKVIN